MILYEVQLLMESGAYKDALKFLEDFKLYISDTLAYAELKGNELIIIIVHVSAFYITPSIHVTCSENNITAIGNT